MTNRLLTVVPLVLLAFTLSLAAPIANAPQENSSAKKNDETQTKDATAREDAAVFDERAAAIVLGTIRDGLEGHSQRRLLSAFDSEKMAGFLTFEDQIEAYFTRYESFRVTLHIIQTSEESNRGVILAEFQLENEPRGGGRISRREGQLRFQLERGSKGWKIVDVNPRGFFS